MKKKRLGFVGLSTPLFYDYAVTATKAQSDLFSSPNPVLDSGFGLMLLFDELWFLCRSLCPENMRVLSFVRFMDEESLLPPLHDIKPLNVEHGEHHRRGVDAHFKEYRERMHRVGIHWDAMADNHTHTLSISGLETTANVVNLNSLFLDLAILDRIANPALELVTNGVTDGAFGHIAVFAKARLTELLLIERVPNYLSANGPYHASIEEAREHPYLRDYREWLASAPVCPAENELRDFKRSVESALEESQRTLFQKFLEPRNAYQTVAKTLGGLVIDALTGGALSAAYDLEKERQDERRRQALRYQGFILALRR